MSRNDPGKKRVYDEKYRQTAGYKERRKRHLQSPKVRARQREYQLRKQFGIDGEFYDLVLEMQGGHCALCPATVADRSGKPLHVDHDHKTGKFRGLLCTTHNHGVGNFQDNPARLRAAADYLEIRAG